MKSWKSPAKLNLYLSIIGIRERDGFHELDSIVSLLDFGDVIEVGLSEDGRDHFQCSDPRLSWNEGNLMHRAAELYRGRTGWDVPLSIGLEKHIPMGAGLGGGSSNASTLLKALNAINPQPVETGTLMQWSAELGSDCPLFFSEGLIRIQGRGEQVSQVESPLLETLRNRKILLVHPGFPIAASWAYRKLKESYPQGYTTREQTDLELQQWFTSREPWTRYHRNDLSGVVDRKFLAIPGLKDELRERFGLTLRMSGSGSACFCIIESEYHAEPVIQVVRECWGGASFIKLCRILEPT